jgi:transposase-like protein
MPRVRRKFTSQTKFKAALDLLQGKRPATEIARTYRVHPNSLLLWKDTVLRRGHELFETSSPADEHAKQVAELEQLLGRKELELALLKNFLGRTG